MIPSTWTHDGEPVDAHDQRRSLDLGHSAYERLRIPRDVDPIPKWVRVLDGVTYPLRGSRKNLLSARNGISQIAEIWNSDNWLPGRDANHDLDKILKSHNVLIYKVAEVVKTPKAVHRYKIGTRCPGRQAVGYRAGIYPPLRGTLVTLDDAEMILYTRGSVDFFETYPGKYMPVPLRLRCDDTEQTQTFLAREVLALTKMNWNNTQFDGAEPVTLRASRQCSRVLRYCSQRLLIEPRYSFYM
jgi:hypothetical protein